MKLVRFGARGRERAGVLDLHNRPRDLSGVLADITAETVQEPAFSAIRSIDAERLPLVEPQVRLGPCIGRVGKLVCVGLNYPDHAREAGTSAPSEPVLFMKATSAISGPTDAIEIPVGASKVDWEVELGVVIGSRAKSVSVAAALEHVLGYCVVNDVSERAFQLEGTGQWVKGKSADTFAPIGPWLVTADEVPDPQNLNLWLRVNGRMRQQANTREMIFGVAFIVSYVSRYMTLMPGDIIATGTPPGVGLGATPPTFLQKGDVVTLGIDGLGEQRQELVGA
jgi:2-keto-4-pentenoate hydratase/2-oxohepta-3-ene-1,7-dioic acid hydratase in catechol pathway